MIPPDVPTSPAVGVPVSAPEALEKLAQAGMLVIEKVSELPSESLAAGAKL
jgi:hypothetical protein